MPPPAIAAGSPLPAIVTRPIDEIGGFRRQRQRIPAQLLAASARRRTHLDAAVVAASERLVHGGRPDPIQP
jgi:hypothetical protein